MRGRQVAFSSRPGGGALGGCVFAVPRADSAAAPRGHFGNGRINEDPSFIKGFEDGSSDLTTNKIRHGIETWNAVAPGRGWGQEDPLGLLTASLTPVRFPV